MKFIVAKNLIDEAVQVCSRAVSQRSPLPILNHLLFNFDGQNLKISATDLELGIEYQIPAQGEESGSFTAPARVFLEIISNLPPGDVVMETTENQLKVSSHGSEFILSTLSAEEFPLLPRPEGLPVLKLETDTLREMLNLVLFCCATADETRAVLTGVLFSLNENMLTMVATDGRRLAKMERTISQLFPEHFQTIIPGKSLNELQKLLKDDKKEVEIAFGEGQVFFFSGSLFLVSRVLEGQFPDYQVLIHKEYKSRAVMEKNAFLNGVKRALITAQERQNPGMIKLAFGREKLEISSNTADLGQAKEEVKVELEGDEITIAFNGRYVLDFLSHSGAEKVGVDMRDPQASANLFAVGDEHYLCLVMPIRIREEIYS